MSEPSYELIHPEPPPHPFIHVFAIRNGPDEGIGFRRVTVEDFKSFKDPVIDWLTERFGEGAVSTPGHPFYETGSYSLDREAVEAAWSMDWEGSVAFQAESHAIEFRLRWCG